MGGNEKAAERVNLCSSVTDRLGRRILAGEIAPGEPVPTEAALCESLGVSRTTVREAVKRLHGKGLVDGGPRCGMRVTPTSSWNQLDPDVLAWRMAVGANAETLDQLYEIRECVEPRACALAARHADAAARAELAAELARMQDEAADSAAVIAADVAFHMRIFAATGNPFLASLGAAIRAALLLSFRITQQRQRMPRHELALHAAICDAIRAGEAEAAAEAMRRLLTESRKTIGLALAG